MLALLLVGLIGYVGLLQVWLGLQLFAKYVSFWFPEIPNWISALFCVLILMSFNLLSAKLFGELEFWFAIIKIATIIALIVVGIVMIFIAFKTQFGHTSLTNLYQHGIFPKGASGFFYVFPNGTFLICRNR